MNRSLSHKEHLAISLLLALGIILTLAQPVRAQTIVYGDSVPKDRVVDTNVTLIGVDVAIDGTVNGDVMAFGKTVTVNGAVNGSMVTGGQNLTINGTVKGSVYAASLTMTVGPSADIQRDLYYAGVSLETKSGSQIERDLYAIALGATTGGHVEGKMTTWIGPVNITNFVLKLFNMPPIPLIPTGWMSPQGFVQAPSLIGSGSFSTIRAVSHFQPERLANSNKAALNISWMQPQWQATQITVQNVRNWFITFVRQLVILLLLGLLFAWLAPAPLISAGERIRTSPWQSVGWGLVVFIMGWFVALFVLILVILLAIFFYAITLQALAFLIGGFGITSLGMALSVFWLSFTYFSKVIVSFLIGKLILKLIRAKAAESKLWPLILGVVIYALLASIPYLGLVVAVLATFFGLGALWLVSRPSPKTVETAPVIPAEA